MPIPLSGVPIPLSGGKRQAKAEIFPRAISTTELPSNPSPLTFRNNQIQILQTSSTHATMAANVFQQDTNTHGTRLSHARTRQSFFDTTHKKWSEWKTNRRAVITGRFRRKRQGGGGYLKPIDLKMGKKLKKILVSSKSSCDHSAPVSFLF